MRAGDRRRGTAQARSGCARSTRESETIRSAMSGSSSTTRTLSERLSPLMVRARRGAAATSSLPVLALLMPRAIERETQSPPARQSYSIFPSIWRTSAEIIREPKPVLSGAETVGPPRSSQKTQSLSSFSRHQRTETDPSSWERPPYFTAFVASSCRIIVTVCTASGSTVTGGPSSETRCAAASPA